MAEARAETPDTDDDVHLGNDMDLSPRSHSPSSPVPDAIANNGALFPVSDDNAADPSHGLGPLPVPVGHHDGPLAGRQRAIAVVPPLHPPAVLSKLSDMSVESAARFVNNLRDRYVVAPGEQAEGIESDDLRAGMKRKACDITRSQFEIYNFATRQSLSEAATDELLNLVGNVRDSDIMIIAQSS